MQKHINSNSVMEVRNHFKNGASLKSLMSRGYLLKVLFIVAISALVFSCKDDEKTKDNENNRNNQEAIFQDTIFYYGIERETIITFQEDNVTYSTRAFEGQVIVYFNDGVKLATAQKIISELGGTIIEQIPAIQYYLVKVPAGSEVSFISNIRDKNIEYASLSLSYDLRAVSCQTRILDAFPYRVIKDSHGDAVKSVYDKCTNSTKSMDIDYSYYNNNGKLKIEGRMAINDVVKSRAENTLYNMSFGPKIEVGQKKLTWGEANEEQRKNYIRDQQQQIKDLVLRLKTISEGKPLNIVITLAAGNEGMPDFDKNVIEPMISSRPPVQGTIDFRLRLDNVEKEILKNNILIVTSTEPTTNKTEKNNAMATVDIGGLEFNGKQLEGSSFAAPKALCIVRQVMEIQKENGNNLTAVEALAAVKKAVKLNLKGELNIDEAKKIALDEYGGKKPIEEKGCWIVTFTMTLYPGATPQILKVEEWCDRTAAEIKDEVKKLNDTGDGAVVITYIKKA